MGLLMATLVAFGVMAGTTQAFAAGSNVTSEYDQVAKDKIVGTITITDALQNAGKDANKDGNLYYQGVVSGSVETSDLLEGAYQKYIKDFKGKTDSHGRAFENLVMFDKGQNFPTAKYTVIFPTPTPDPTPTPNPPTPELKPQSEKRIGMLPKTGESASFAGLLATLGFSIAGLAILHKKKMMKENNKQALPVLSNQHCLLKDGSSYILEPPFVQALCQIGLGHFLHQPYKLQNLCI